MHSLWITGKYSYFVYEKAGCSREKPARFAICAIGNKWWKRVQSETARTLQTAPIARREQRSPTARFRGVRLSYSQDMSILYTKKAGTLVSDSPVFERLRTKNCFYMLPSCMKRTMGPSVHATGPLQWLSEETESVRGASRRIDSQSELPSRIASRTGGR